MERKREVEEWREWKWEKERKEIGLGREEKLKQESERLVVEMERWNREVEERGSNETEKWEREGNGEKKEKKKQGNERYERISLWNSDVRHVPWIGWNVA